jgi:hypothetical protein
MRHPRLNALTAEAIRSAASRLRPEDVRKWAVVIDEREFPVKQIVREAANGLNMAAAPVTPMDFIAHDAVRILRRLGFDKQLKYYER